MVFRIHLIAAFYLFAASVCAETVTFPHKGAAYVSWTPGEYSSPASAASLDDLKTTGANACSLLVTYYMSGKSANAMAADKAKTPTDGDVRAAIRDMHNRGLKVMLKPHVDVKDGTWRGEITPARSASWFSSYNTFITKYAQIAQQEGVELFCVGCELRTLSGSGYSARWATIIANIRKVYKGPLTYAANGSNVPDEYRTVSFWNLLDIAGVDVYFPLTSFYNPTVEQLVSAWTGNRLGQNFVSEMRSFQAAVGKPVLFTEMGYQSAEGTNSTPWYTSGGLNFAEQQNCYEAAFQIWSKEAWLQGMFWWGWAVPPTPASDTQFSARSKPAQDTLQKWYAPPPPSSPPQMVAARGASAEKLIVRRVSRSVLRGTLPVPENFVASDLEVIVELGGVANSVTLNSRGSGRTDGIALKIMPHKRRGVIAAQDAGFVLKWVQGDRNTALPIAIRFNGGVYYFSFEN